MPDEICLDTVTLSNFALSDSFHLIVERYRAKAVVTQQVLDEIADGVLAGYEKLGSIEQAVDEGSLAAVDLCTGDERRLYRTLIRVLSPGEASCIARAAPRGGTVATDDRRARDACAEHGVPVTGTIGILKALVDETRIEISEADAILDRMIASGFYSPVRRVSSIC